jgi:hypothetical protein
MGRSVLLSWNHRRSPRPAPHIVVGSGCRRLSSSKFVFRAPTQVARSDLSSRRVLLGRCASHPAATANRRSRSQPSTLRWPASRDDRSRHSRGQIPRRLSQRNQTDRRHRDRRNRCRKWQAHPRTFRREHWNLQHHLCRRFASSVPLRRTPPSPSQAKAPAQFPQSRSFRLSGIPNRERHLSPGLRESRRRATAPRFRRQPPRTQPIPHSRKHHRQSSRALASAAGRAHRRHGYRRRSLHRPRHPSRFPALRHLSHSRSLRHERNHPSPSSLSGPSAACASPKFQQLS